MISEFSTMGQYDEYVQQRRRSYQDAQYDLKMLTELVDQVKSRVGVLFGWLSPRAAHHLPDACLPSYQEQNEFASALNAGLPRGLGRC